MKFPTAITLFALPLLAVATDPLYAPPVASSIAIPDHLPCCVDMPAMTSLGLLSQSVVKRSQKRSVF
jgi:hypothetical protein